jgi:hypothetical protein
VRAWAMIGLISCAGLGAESVCELRTVRGLGLGMGFWAWDEDRASLWASDCGLRNEISGLAAEQRLYFIMVLFGMWLGERVCIVYA